MNTSIRTDRILILVLLALLGLVFATSAMEAQAPYPGFWHCGTAAASLTPLAADAAAIHYCPCSVQPLEHWTDPETGQEAFRRYDFGQMKFPQNCPGLGGDPPCVYGGSGGYSHSLTWLWSGHEEVAIQKQPPVDKFYPAPFTSELCDVWHANGNTGTCPTATRALYQAQMANVSSWREGYNSAKPFILADPGCGGSGLPTPSKTPTSGGAPSKTPTKAPTPDPCAPIGGCSPTPIRTAVRSATPSPVSKTPTPASGCGSPSPVSLCLSGRFRVAADWTRSDGSTGHATAIPLTSDTGAFWFFSPGNYEVMVKVLDGCAINAKWWNFAGGLTNVAVTLSVTDTKTGAQRIYQNAQGNLFQPIADTAAFVCK